MDDDKIIITIQQAKLPKNNTLVKFFDGLGEGYNKRISRKNEDSSKESVSYKDKILSESKKETLDLDQKYHINLPKDSTKVKTRRR